MLGKNRNNLIFFVIFCLFCLSLNRGVNALTYGGCEYSKISRLKAVVSNINLSYDYHIDDGKVYFDVTINNITPEIYFVDSETGRQYDYSNTNDGELILRNYTKSGGKYKFYSQPGVCNRIPLGIKYYNFPTYNKYHDSELCQNNKNYTICKKWQKIAYSYSEFKKKIEEYNAGKDELVEEEIKPVYEKTILDVLAKLYIDYYYIILVGIILICVVIMIISKKKNSFDL